MFQTAAPIAGSDNDRHIIRAAMADPEAAEVNDLIRWQVPRSTATRPTARAGVMISNPPYGVRLAEVQALQALYPQLGSWLEQHYAGWLAGMLTADRDMPGAHAPATQAQNPALQRQPRLPPVSDAIWLKAPTADNMIL